MPDRTSISEYPVRDMWLASSLIAMGHPLVRVTQIPRRRTERPGPPWCVFHVQDSPDRPHLVQEYLTGTLSVPVAKLRTAFNHCRDQMRVVSGTDGEGA